MNRYYNAITKYRILINLRRSRWNFIRNSKNRLYHMRIVSVGLK